MRADSQSRTEQVRPSVPDNRYLICIRWATVGFNDAEGIKAPKTPSYSQCFMYWNISNLFAIATGRFLAIGPHINPRRSATQRPVCYSLQSSPAAIAIDQRASTEIQNCILFFPMLAS